MTAGEVSGLSESSVYDEVLDSKIAYERNRWFRQNRPEWLMRQLRANAKRSFTHGGMHRADVASMRSWSPSFKIMVERERFIEAEMLDDEERAHANYSRTLWERSVGKLIPWGQGSQ